MVFNQRLWCYMFCVLVFLLWCLFEWLIALGHPSLEMFPRGPNPGHVALAKLEEEGCLESWLANFSGKKKKSKRFGFVQGDVLL